MASGTQVRRVLLQIQADEGDSEAKIDAIAAKAEELSKLHPELKVKIDTAAAAAKMRVLRDDLVGLAKAPVEAPIVPEVDNSEAEVKIIGLKSDLEELKARADEALVMKVDDADAKVKILQLKASLAALDERVTPEISDAGIAKANAEVAALVLKLDALSVKKVEPLVEPKVDEPAAVDAGVKAADSVNRGFRFRMSWVAAGWSSLIAVSLAALPALAGGIGALAGGLLAAKLLVGSRQVKGPLYAQWTELSQGLMSVLRTSTLPLLEPLRQVFAQIGQWARAIKPELTAAFASIGPLIAPLAKGLESVVSGLLPGFITLMRAAAPAVAALSGLLGGVASALGGVLAGLAPAVRASSVVLGALGSLVRALLPVVTSLARSLAGALGPALGAIARVFALLAPPVSRVLGLLAQIGGSVLTTVVGALARILPPAAQLVTVLLNGLEPILPRLEKSFQQMANAVTGQMMNSILQALPQVGNLIRDLLTLAQNVIIPLLPQIAQLTGDLLIMQQDGLLQALGPVTQLADTLANLANNVIVPLMPLIQQLTGWLVSMANTAVQAMNAVNSVLSLFGVSLGGGGGAGAFAGPGLAFPGVSVPPGVATAGYAAGSSYGAAYGSAWANGVLASTVNTSTKSPAANLALLLAQGLQQQLAGTAAQVKSATSQLISAVTTDEAAGVISRSRGSALQMWLQEDSNRLQSLATRRATILARIAVAEKYASSVATSIRNQDTLASAAAGGWNGGPQTNRQIVANLQMDVAKINKFAQSIAKLKKLGLNPTYLDQLIQMGPDAGGQLAEQLANSGIATIRQVNSAESQIYRASGQLGKTAADSMYDSGAQAGKGFLSGLEAQQKAIEQVMQKIAASMVNTIKRELGIHSPSTVARQLAREWPNGLVLGLEDGHGDVMTASGRLARAMVPQHGAGAGYGAAGVPSWRLEIDLRNADREMRTWLKKSIRITGGQVSVIGA